MYSLVGSLAMALGGVVGGFVTDSLTAAGYDLHVAYGSALFAYSALAVVILAFYFCLSENVESSTTTTEAPTANRKTLLAQLRFV